MIDPNQPIAVTLKAGDWNTVLALLAEAPAPWKLSHPVIQTIQAQCMALGNQLPEEQSAQNNVVPIAGE